LSRARNLKEPMSVSTNCDGPLLHGPGWRAGARDRAEDRCSLARLLFGLGQAQITGVIRVLAPVGDGGEEKHELYMRLGRVVHVRPPYLDEPLGHILRDMGLLDHETYARSLLAMAEERARHGTVLRKMGVVSDEQLAGALAVQILRRSARMFRLRAGRYAVDPYEHEYGVEGEVAARGIGVRRVIYNGVSAGYDEADLVWELNLLAGRRMRLRREEARRLGRYGFGQEARAVLELLSIGYVDPSQLIASATASETEHTTAVLKVLYTLLVTELLEVEEVAPERSVRTPAPDRVGTPLPPAAPAPAAAAPAPRSAPRRAVIPRPVAEPQPVAGRARPGTTAPGGQRRAVAAAPGAKLETLEQFRKGSRTRPSEKGPDRRVLEGRARFLRGEAYLRKGDLEMALTNLRAAATLAPDDPDVKAMLALAVWRAPGDEAVRAEQARRLLADALGRSPSCARAYRVFGEIYAAQALWEQAIRCYAKVVQLVPDDVEAAREMKRLEKKRARPSIFSLFKKS
jgi:hypothetical protein